MEEIQMDRSWFKKLNSELQSDYMQNLMSFLEEERSKGKILYPAEKNIFNAFNKTPFKNVKVVIIGQDPYHGPDQAQGLCFSVKKGLKIPPSLKNIYKELLNDLNLPIPTHGELTSWAKEGVLLLNAVLTVEKGRPGSHRDKGWEIFTDKVIQILNDEKENLVFLLWGNDAKKKGQQIDKKKHLVLESAHPSPFSARNFYNNHHFSKTNKFLIKHSIAPINWKIPDCE